jgi:23S rRNA pseudouridine1911/1915/1917 synthase
MDNNENQSYSGSEKRRISHIEVSGDCILMDLLLEKFSQRNRNFFKTLLKFKKIKVDDRVVFQYNYPLRKGQIVEINWEKESDKSLPGGIEILYEDHDIIVINKPAGMLAVATLSEKTRTAYSILSNHVKKQHRNNKIYVIHRLDRETSGIMMYAKNHDIKESIKEDWYNNVPERTYVAVVEGRIQPPSGTIMSWLKENRETIVYSSHDKEGKKAVTHYETLQGNEDYSLLKIELETGRKNQIRVHMQDKEVPVTGDRKYGAELNPISRLALHAMVLAFLHPRTGKLMRFESRIPDAFLRLVR